eukprot:1177309-Prorocentrum_minimum.AAC.3
MHVLNGHQECLEYHILSMIPGFDCKISATGNSGVRSALQTLTRVHDAASLLGYPIQSQRDMGTGPLEYNNSVLSKQSRWRWWVCT